MNVVETNNDKYVNNLLESNYRIYSLDKDNFKSVSWGTWAVLDALIFSQNIDFYERDPTLFRKKNLL